MLRIRIRMCLSLLDPDPEVWIWIWIRILLLSSKNSKKTMIPTVLWLLFDFLSLKNDVNVPSNSNKQKNFFLNEFFVGVLKVNDVIARSGCSSQRHGSADPDPDLDPHQNVVDPQHCSGFVTFYSSGCWRCCLCLSSPASSLSSPTLSTMVSSLSPSCGSWAWPGRTGRQGCGSALI